MNINDVTTVLNFESVEFWVTSYSLAELVWDKCTFLDWLWLKEHKKEIITLAGHMAAWLENGSYNDIIERTLKVDDMRSLRGLLADLNSFRVPSEYAYMVVRTTVASIAVNTYK